VVCSGTLCPQDAENRPCLPSTSYASGVTEEPLPAWSLPAEAVERISLPEEWPGRMTREWAWGGADGSGTRVCVLDSGIEAGHSMVGEVQQSVAVSVEGDLVRIDLEDTEGDLCGHGTACAGVIRSLAPKCELTSVRVLGAGYTGSGRVLLEGLRWAVEQGYDVINMSLSTTKQKFAGLLHELADSAYFRRTMVVASAHNMPVESYPWRFSSVISVGSHEQPDPFAYYYNPAPPVEFFARGVDVEVAWNGGGRLVCTGNSFATPHIAGIAALVLSKHPELTPFQLKSLLYLTATNVVGGDE
jgi:subtilisin